MHKRIQYKIIICTLLCILLTICFSSITYAFYYQLLNTTHDNLQFDFTPEDGTGLYVVRVFQSGYLGFEKFTVDRIVTRPLGGEDTVNVSLASVKRGNSIKLVNSEKWDEERTFINNSGLNNSLITSAYVILDSNSRYKITHYGDQKEISIIVQKVTEDGDMYGFSTNAPSAWVTLKEMNSSIVSADPVLENYPKLEISNAELDKFIEENGIEEKGNDDQEKGDFLESILTHIVLAIGTLILGLFEMALGMSQKRGITLDNIIFNRLEPANRASNPIIDLRPLGGIGNSLGGGATADGILYNTLVVQIVTTLFNSLRVIALVLYVVLLLYVGLRMLIAVGTKDEPKSKKFFQYWLTGLILLMVVPYFLPALPYLNNELIKTAAESANTSGSYSIADVAKFLGVQYHGEDAEIIVLKEKLQEEIQRLQGLLGSTSTNPSADVEQAKQKVEDRINSVIGTLETMNNTGKTYFTASDIDNIKNKYNEIVEYVYTNYRNWSDENDTEFNNMLIEINALIWNGTGEDKGKKAYYSDSNDRKTII